MKKIAIALVAVMTSLTFSCSDDDDNDGNDNDNTYINFKVNGTQMNIDSPSTITTLKAAVVGIEDAGDDIRTIILTMPVDATVGEHAISDSPSDLTTYNASYSIGDVSVDGTGTIEITNIGTEYMTGTFSFTGVYEGTTYNITDGVFRADKPAEN